MEQKEKGITGKGNDAKSKQEENGKESLLECIVCVLCKCDIKLLKNVYAFVISCCSDLSQ